MQKCDLSLLPDALSNFIDKILQLADPLLEHLSLETLEAIIEVIDSAIKETAQNAVKLSLEECDSANCRDNVLTGFGSARLALALGGTTIGTTKQAIESIIKRKKRDKGSKTDINEVSAHHDEMHTTHTMTELKGSYRNIENQVAFEYNGVTAIFDGIGSDGYGKFRIAETKTGNAQLTKNQKTVLEGIKNGEAVPTMKRADNVGLEKGRTLKDQGIRDVEVMLYRYPAANEDTFTKKKTRLH